MTSISNSHIARARTLRANMTNGEKTLWQELRKFRRLHNIHFRRQVPIGPYTVDFAAHSKRYVLELDGEQHQMPVQKLKDRSRDEFLQKRGYRVRRISTGALIENQSGCIETIMHDLNLMEDKHDH